MTTTVPATELQTGMSVRRFDWTGSEIFSVILDRTERTLNDGRVVVTVSYGHGMGATFYSDDEVTVL